MGRPKRIPKTPEHILARQRAWHRDYVRRNPHVPQICTSRHKSKLYGAPSTLTSAEWLERLEWCGYRCEKCGVHASQTALKKLTLDHQKPFCQGGSNTRRNIAALCARCNESKGDDWVDFGSIEKPVRPPKLIRKGHDPRAIHIPLLRTKRRKAKLDRVRVTAPVTDELDLDDLLS